jgi:hypothetical protein
MGIYVVMFFSVRESELSIGRIKGINNVKKVLHYYLQRDIKSRLIVRKHIADTVILIYLGFQVLLSALHCCAGHQLLRLAEGPDNQGLILLYFLMSNLYS